MPDSLRGVALQLFISVSSRSHGHRPTFDTVFKWPHQQRDNQRDKGEHLPCQLRGGNGGVEGGWGSDRERGVGRGGWGCI